MVRQKTVLITGASSGIGLEFAKVFAKNGWSLVISARRKERLENLKKEIARKIKETREIWVIEKDLADPKAAHDMFSWLDKNNIKIDVLVNNAGFGLHGKFFDTNLKVEQEMIDVNVKAVVGLTKEFLKRSKVEKDGWSKKGIINVASTASFMPGPGASIYYASKAFVLSFSKALRYELMTLKVPGLDISPFVITTLCPGLTCSEFHSKSGMNLSSSKVMNWLYMDAKEVAEIGYGGFMKGKAVVIPGWKNKVIVFLMKSPLNYAFRRFRSSLEK